VTTDQQVLAYFCRDSKQPGFLSSGKWRPAPTFWRLSFFRAHVFVHTWQGRGDFAAAITHWELALAINPLFSGAWFELAFAALKEGDDKKALKVRARSLNLTVSSSSSVVFVDKAG
jgi:tetratricopeptide (TPR) repeat protein